LLNSLYARTITLHSNNYYIQLKVEKTINTHGIIRTSTLILEDFASLIFTINGKIFLNKLLISNLFY